MASPNLYNHGAGGTTGSSLATSSPLYALNGGHLWYVSSTTGADAASPRGEDRAKPLATAAQAVTNASAGDTIVFLSGHTENLAAAIAASKLGLKFVSEGTGANAARFTCASTGGCFNITAGTVLSGLYFPASTTAATNARVDVATAAPCLIENCTFDQGASDTTAAIRWGSVASSVGLRIEGCSFTATAATQAAISISVVTNAASALTLQDVTIDGGTVGFSDFAIKLAVAATNMDVRNLNLLNNSHVSLAAGCTGTLLVGTVSGGSRIEQS